MINGECLCGAVAFELEPSSQYGPDRSMGMCHCSACQRWTGGSSLPFVAVVPERFRITRGGELVAHYRDEQATMRAFCRRCGSCLFQDVGRTYHVSAGVLRDLVLRPAFHLHLAERAGWTENDCKG